MADQTEVFWSPGDVARHLGVSPSGLRRLAGVYAELYGELPKDAGGTSRQWPSGAVYRLEQARALIAAGQARSIKDALLAIEGGATLSADAALALGQEGRVVEALGVVSSQLKALQDINSDLRAEVAVLRSEAREWSALPGDPGALASVESPGNLPAPANDGLLVKLARRLERMFRRFSS